MQRKALMSVTWILVWTVAGISNAQETTVQNDSLAGGDQGTIQAGFIAGESAAAWLTSPCNGNIVAVQVFWRSLIGGSPPSLEDSITIFDGGVFATPGSVLLNSGVQPAEILGPVMTDGVINEFRFLDENMVIPLSVPVLANDVFVVSFKFLNTPSPVLGPSVVTDSDGCQTGKNGVFAVPGGWFGACLLGVTGDFVIRAVVDCNPTQACCFDADTCVNLTAADCGTASGFPQGPGTDCNTFNCFPIGACCMPDGNCMPDLSPSDCGTAGGTYQGDDTDCLLISCPAPSGACCLSNGNCLFLNETDCTAIPNASWAGLSTDCTDADNNMTADACEPGVCGDGTQDVGEECDDGNIDPGDGCDENCQIEPFCGDGTVDPGEDCEQDSDCPIDNVCLSCACIPPGIPTMSQWGVFVMILLVLAAGTIVFRRKDTATS